MKKLITLALLVVFSLACFSQTTDARKVFKPSYIKKTMKKATAWQLKNPRHEPTDWTNGAFYAGVTAAWETTQSKSILKAMMEMGEKNGWKPGRRWFHADDIAICQTYVDLYKREKRQEMIQPFLDTIAIFMKKPYPVKGNEVIKWWWCDALFMGPPAMVKLSAVTGNSAYAEYSDRLFHECYDLLYDKEEHLFARDLKYVIKNDGKDVREANGKKIFWSRGNGWVMGGIVRVLQELPADHPGRKFYVGLLRDMSARLKELQQPDGLWRASLLDPEAYPGGEVSGSGFDCYAIAWGINNNLLDKATYLPVVEKAWIGLNRCVNKEGRVGWVQPIGADPRKNFSEESWEVYGTGAYLLAGSEIIKMKR
ncbi:MAG: glycoside hydrolase family 88 protein [Marinilabiliales bacterium]|nr:glycoside hydrolase family 88 protein [Marinilabiliales bacterium]